MASEGKSLADLAAGEGAPVDPEAPFWRRLTLEEMSPEEWESLCDGCARCCLNKLEDEDSGVIEWTAVACRLLDVGTCRCSDYDGRKAKVPDCIQLTPDLARSLTWLPPTCAYRLVAEGRDLYWWHPLVSGSRDTVHEAGISVRGRVISETAVPLALWEQFVVKWPNRRPRRKAAAQQRGPATGS